MHSPYYPAGVTDKMIDEYFNGDDSCCKYCRHFSGGICYKKEASADEDELLLMTDSDYIKAFGVDDDDYCDDYDYDDSNDLPPWEE